MAKRKKSESQLLTGYEGVASPTARIINCDIREYKQAEQALRESEENYRSLIESARDAIFTLSPTGMITSVNSAFEKITGWSCTEWIGKSFVSILHPNDLQTAMDLFGSLLRGDVLPIFELRVLFKSGEYGLGEFTVTPQIQGGKVKGFLGIARDITERKKAEAALRQEKVFNQTLVQASPLFFCCYRSRWENLDDE